MKALAQAGYEIVVYDDLSAGHREATRGVPLVEGDVLDTARLRQALRESGATAVMHFAARLAVGESVRDPLTYYRQNVVGMVSVLEAMTQESVRRLVFSSTAAVYGEPRETPIGETHPLCPVNAYGETKLAMERALPHFGRAYGLRSVALRYFNASGADPDGELGEAHNPEIHLIPLAIEAALGGGPLQMFGDDYPTPDGTCQRDYVHVTDLAQAHVLALQALEKNEGASAYNLGNGRACSVREVVRTVERLTGRPVPCEVAARRPGDPAVLLASSDKIKRELGWQPRYEDLDPIVETAWRWRAGHPHGFEAR